MFYQIVTFLERQPKVGESIYGDENGGWLPQLALKRRFKLAGIDEDEFLVRFGRFIKHRKSFGFTTGEVTRPDKMPVDAIPLKDDRAVLALHNDFLREFYDVTVSKYIDREGEHFFPHITVEYWGKRVIDTAKFESRRFEVGTVWVVKDGDDSSTYTLKSYQLG